MRMGKRRTEGLEASRASAELVAVLVVVTLEPAGTNAQIEPTVGDMVGGAGDVGQ
jgi:hypothetical protein